MNEPKKENLAVGLVVEALPSTHFRIEITGGEVVLAYLGGKMKIHKIKVLLGDRVEVVLDPYGGKARIVKRL